MPSTQEQPDTREPSPSPPSEEVAQPAQPPAPPEPAGPEAKTSHPPTHPHADKAVSGELPDDVV